MVFDQHSSPFQQPVGAIRVEIGAKLRTEFVRAFRHAQPFAHALVRNGEGNAGEHPVTATRQQSHACPQSLFILDLGKDAPPDRDNGIRRQDQRVRSYGTFAELEAYCELSANPVGRLVLQVFGAATPERVMALATGTV